MQKSIGDNTHLISSSSLHPVNKSVTVRRYRAESVRSFQFLLIITITLLSAVHSKPCSAVTGPNVVNVESELEFPPYAFVDENSQAAGFSVDLIKAVTNVMGLSIKISTGTWDSVWGDLVAGRTDVLPIVKANGDYQRIYDKWLTIDDPWQKYKKHIMPLVLVLITIALISGIWLVMLRRLVRKRTLELTERNEMLIQIRDGLDKTVAKRTAELTSLNTELLSEIAERKRSEDELRESEKRFKNIVNASPMGMHLYELRDDDRLVFIGANPASDQILGVNHKEFIGKLIEEAFPGLVRTEVPTRYRDVARNGKTWHTEQIDYNEGLIRGAFEVVAFQTGKNKMAALFHNITERKRAEEALRESEERLRLAVYGGSVGIWEWDVVTNQLDWNNQLKAIFGLPVSSTGLTLEKFMSAIYPDDLADTEHSFRMALEQHTEFRHEYRIVWPDGSVHWIVAIGRGIYDPDGRPLRMLGCALDISERRKAEEALRVSEERYRMLYRGTPVMMHSIDRYGRLVSVSDYWLNTLGYSREEVIGRRSSEFLTDASCRYAQEVVLPDFMQTGVCKDIEYQFVKKNGEVIDTLLSAIAERDSSGQVLRSLAVIINVTERKQAEQEKEKLQAQLLQAQKMEAIGLLAGGVAHDFNNILSAIVGYAHMMLIKMRDDDPLRMNVERILASSEKAANLTKSLLAFSRKQVMQMKFVNLNSIVLGMAEILDRVIGEDIYLQVNTAGNDLVVNVDTNQIEQVIMNLTTNARDAMPGGGTITVTTEEIEIDEKYIQIHQDGEAGKYAVLSVTDTGMGMDEKTRENIFDPFFTTKEVGKGTGLGLAMIFGTIKQHDGFINVYSEPGKGTTFRIYLPLAEEGVKVMEEKGAASLPYGTETVLLVEDDENVRNVTRAVLEEYGYSVMEAMDGKRALELFRENRERIHLVITDIIMPGQSGKDLHNELMKIVAEIKIIFISGYPADVLAKKGIIDSNVNFISKPVNPEILLKKIREVLEK